MKRKTHSPCHTAPHPESSAATMIRLNAEGWPNIAIASHLGCSRENVSLTLKYWGKKAAPKRRIAAEAGT